ncbi:MAG TPA: PIN domain-containing protein [Acidobacteriaceae bacterium]|jgi:predicted nucleic acid-binding protein|nr:PIN domain-containing protein [Acidobacteriaceae bacterium]
MSAPVFVDSNVLIYWVDGDDPEKQRIAALWIEELWRSRSGRISFQVLQEFFYAATRRKPDMAEPIRAEVRSLLAWHPVSPDGALLERAWKVQDRYRLSFWDALIVAAAKAAQCGWLLTEDLQADQDLDGIVVVNPFTRMPDELLIP